MTLLSLGGIAVRFADTTILEDVTFMVGRGDCWGVIGRNGIGKTSLFEVITGDLVPATGSVAKASGLKVAVLDQHRTFEAGETVWEAAAGAYRELRRLETVIADDAEALATAEGDEAERLMARYARNLERFEHEGGYTVTARVDAILDGLGFDHVRARTQLVATLSGGERGRIGLAAQLAADADLLLLDEPTNHLDIAGIDWLEGHLRESEASSLVISHDRAFLAAVTDHILHLEDRTGVVYNCDYTEFGEQRAFRRLSQQRAFDKQSKSIAKEEDFIRRNLAGQKSSQAVGRRRRLDRLPRLSAPPADLATMAIRFDPRSRGGDQVLVVEQLGIELAGRTLLQDFSGTIRRGDVVGLVGPNGAGKTTMLATLLGEREPARGSSRIGESIEVEYYRQDLGDVPPDKTLFDIVHDLRPKWTRGQVHDHLGRIGFTGDTGRRRAESLSGGETARLSLGRLMLSGANFLVFDEPTNHLDVETIESLEDAIAAFEGTVLLVSHDRALLRSLTTRTWALSEGRIDDYPGSYGEWEDWQADRTAAAQVEAARVAREQEARQRSKGKDTRSSGPRPLTAAKRALDAAESAVQNAEQEVASLGAALDDASLYQSGDGARRAAELSQGLERAKRNLMEAMAEWERASLEVERLAG